MHSLWHGQLLWWWLYSTIFLRVQCWVRLHVDNFGLMRGYHRLLPCLWCRFQLRRRQQPGGRVSMLTWVGLNCHDIKRLRLFNDRLRRGQRVCGRGSTARRLYMQRWLCFNLDDDSRVCGYSEHLRCVRCRLQLRRRWRPGGRVFVLSWMGLNCDVIQRLRHDVFHMFDHRLQCGKCVLRRDGATGRLRVQPRIRFNIHDDDRVCKHHGHVRAVC